MAELQANTEQQLGSGLFVSFAIGLAMGFGIGLAGSYRLRQLQSELSEQVDDASNQFFPQHGGQNVTVRMGCTRVIAVRAGHIAPFTCRFIPVPRCPLLDLNCLALAVLLSSSHLLRVLANSKLGGGANSGLERPLLYHQRQMLLQREPFRSSLPDGRRPTGKPQGERERAHPAAAHERKHESHILISPDWPEHQRSRRPSKV